MRSLRTVRLGSLRWAQRGSFSEDYELSEDGEILGGLVWKTSCGTLASAECADGRWTFKRVGFLNPCVTVREAGSETNAAVFRPKLWGDGLLEIAGGRTMEWKPAGFWRREWSFCEADGAPLVAFKPENTEGLKGLFKSEARVEYPSAASSRADFPLLVFLGWYLLLLYQRDAATTAVVVAASG